MDDQPTVRGTLCGGVSVIETTLDYAYVHDIRSADVRSTFIRLVRPGEQTPAVTFEAECTVDVDGNGRIIGVTVHRYGDEATRW